MNLRNVILSLGIVIITVGGSGLLWKLRPRPVEEEIPQLITPVSVIKTAKRDVVLQIVSQGVLEAKTLTTAASEVSGKVLMVSPQFEAGGRFVKGDVLLEIDPADYKAVLAQAESAVADARLALKVEKAKAEQAVRDWKKLGRAQAPSELVKRTPQLASAEARLTAAIASVEKAQRDLERTRLRAPYDGRIIRTHTDLGSFVAMGSPLADFYKTGDLEVRLPLSLEDFEFIRGVGSEVSLTTETEVNARSWKAVIVRQDSEVDRRTRSMHLIAAVDEGDDAFLVPGLFVRASIVGTILEEVIELPRKALLGQDQVLVVSPDNTLNRRAVTVARTGQDTAIISGGLGEGEQVATTYVPSFIEGMTVEIVTDIEDSNES